MGAIVCVHAVTPATAISANATIAAERRAGVNMAPAS